MQDTVMQVDVIVNGQRKSPFDLDGLTQAIQQREIALSALPSAAKMKGSTNHFLVTRL